MIFAHYFIFIKSDKDIKHFESGMTNDFPQFLRDLKQLRMLTSQGKSKEITTSKLIYYEHTTDYETARIRLRQIQNLPPSKRSILIERQNPFWRDLGEEWFR